jgi:chromosomal replication initiator protein
MLRAFVKLPENRAARRAIDRLLHQAERELEFPTLYLHGDPGSGKSHLAQSLVERFAQTRPTSIVQTVVAAELARELLQPPTERKDLLKGLVDCDLLVLEDLHQFRSDVADLLGHLLDKRQVRKRFTVVTANVGPSGLNLSNRLVGRLVGGLVVWLPTLSIDSRRKLASHFVKLKKLHLTPEAIEWLARRPTTRELIGETQRIESLAKTHRPPLGLDVIARQDIDEPSPLERIVERVSVESTIPVKALRGASRLKNVALARHVAMYVARQNGLSLNDIGKFFGGRDHSTVLHAIHRIDSLKLEDRQLAQRLRNLENLPIG